MKKIILSVVIALSGYYSNAQNIFPLTGNVGIGTLTPSETLTVFGNTQLESTFPYIALHDNAWGTQSYIQAGVDPLGYNGGNYLSFLNASGKGFSFAQGGATRMVIDPSTGNIGIGTTDPQSYKLAVKGSIHTQEVKVDMLNWSDYVFDKTYSLLPLSSVKNYIDQNHHLPEVPSEAQVIESGINVGDMLKLQTKKIEELTLYLIDKDKQLTDQQKQINELKEQLNDIKKSLTKN